MNQEINKNDHVTYSKQDFGGVSHYRDIVDDVSDGRVCLKYHGWVSAERIVGKVQR